MTGHWKARRARYRETRILLALAFPACFTLPGAPFKRPLKIGIDRDLIEAAGPSIAPLGHGDVRRFLSLYCAGRTYACAVARGDHRVALDGSRAGAIAEAHRRRAQDYLERPPRGTETGGTETGGIETGVAA